MAMVVWVMMGISIWHFTVFVPDRFWGGIVGAFLVAALGAVVLGYLANGLTIPGQNDTDIVQALIAIPGAVLALAASYLWGSRADVAQASIRHPRRRARARGVVPLGLARRRGARPRSRAYARGLGQEPTPQLGS